MAATQLIRPRSVLSPIWEPTQPPTRAPPMPRSIVQTQFIGSRPGWSMRANAPATKPKTAQPMMVPIPIGVLVVSRGAREESTVVGAVQQLPRDDADQPGDQRL